MNSAHFHLVLNHFPIIIPIIGGLVMLGGIFLKSEIVKRVAFALFILGALFTIPAFTTGEGAEEAVEHLQGVSENYIHKHEEAAETFAVLSYILGGVSLLSLWANWKQKPFSNLLSFLTVLLCVVALFFGIQAGTTGGEIRHSEIRSGNVDAAPNGKEKDDDED
jgi:uncharacterized membrane protein